MYIYNQRKIAIRKYNIQAKDCEKVLDWRNALGKKCTSFEKTSFIGLANSSKLHLNGAKSKKTQNEYCSKETESYESPFILRGFPTSILDTKNDLRSSENIFNEWNEIDCKMINLSKKLRLRTFQDPLLEMVRGSIESLNE